MKIGIIVGRFQTPILHRGHKELFNTAFSETDHVLVFVGVQTVRTERNPLPFKDRKGMLNAEFSNITITSIKDEVDNTDWVKTLDNKIKSLTNEGDEIIHYGGRDSYLSVLKNTHNIRKVKLVGSVSSTIIREHITPIINTYYRSGYIKAIQDEYKSHAIVTDILITKKDQILLGYKNKLKSYVTIGGFVDDIDTSIKCAAVRELKEETNLSLEEKDLKYVTDIKCNSWSYNEGRNPFTVVYTAEWENNMGLAIPGDDIDLLKWTSLNKAIEIVSHSHHKYMIKKLIESRK